LQTVTAMLAYEDGHKALDWLVRVFQCEVQERWSDDSGRLIHGELSFGEMSLLVASPDEHYQSPNTMRERYGAANQWLKTPFIYNGVMIRTTNIDALYQRAIENGAEILSEFEDGFPGRRFRFADPEGQRWFILETN
jgi:PhnB protein